MQFSVALCTHNPRVDYLARVIAAVAQQDIAPPAFEFFIIDNGSTVPVADVPCVRDAGVRVVAEPLLGLTAARQRAAEVARGEWIVFVDDDNVLERDYLARARELCADRRIGMLSGEIVPEFEVAPARWFRRFQDTLGLRSSPSEQLYLTSVPRVDALFPIGAGCCIRAELLRRYFSGLTDSTRIEGRRGDSLSSSEDLDIGLFAISQGFLVGTSARLRVTHLIPAKRVSYEYLVELNDGVLRSCFEVDAKWSPVFGEHVVGFCGASTTLVRVKILAYGALAWRRAYRVRWRTQRTLLQLLRSRNRVGQERAQ